MKDFITDTSAQPRAGLPAGLGEGASLELGLRAGWLPRVTGAGQRHNCTRAAALTWLPLGQWLHVLCSPRSCQDSGMEGGLSSERSPCPGSTQQVSRRSLLAPMGAGDRGKAWRRPGTPALCTPTAWPLDFHRSVSPYGDTSSNSPTLRSRSKVPDIPGSSGLQTSSPFPHRLPCRSVAVLWGLCCTEPHPAAASTARLPAVPQSA